MFRYWSVAGFLLSRGPGCCICCFCLSPVGGSVISMQAVETLQFCFEYSRSIDFFCHPGVCQRVARCRCSENIPDDILTEILSQQVRDIHHAKRKEGTKDEISLLIFSGVGCCGLGGGVEGLGWIRPSTRGNTVPGEERGWTEVVEPFDNSFDNSLLFQTELHAAFPAFCSWRRWCVHRWGSRGKERKNPRSLLIGDDQGGLEWRQMGNKTCIRHV